MIRLKTNTDNLLHSNPELYAVFENDKSFEMARFIHAILQKYETGKKVLGIVLCAAMAGSLLAGCGNNSSQSTENE